MGRMKQPGQVHALPDRRLNGGAIEGQSVLQRRRLQLEAELEDAAPDGAGRRQAQLELARVLLELQQGEAAFAQARAMLEPALAAADYEAAAAACQAMYRSGRPDSIVALGHGIWLAVACPVDPDLSLQLLRSLVEETPPDADGAAVAAMLGYFLMERRAREPERERLVFLARQLVAEVAGRHRGITGEEAIGVWVRMHELDDVDLLLERMGRVLDAITPSWWFDRDALRQKFESPA